MLLPEHKVYAVLDLKDAFFFSLVRIKSAYPHLNGLTLNWEYQGNWAGPDYLRDSANPLGNKTSKVDYKASKGDTPLNCVLENFDLLYTRKVKKSYILITKNQLQILCEQKWPTFGVEWPPEGTFDPKVAWAVLDVVVRLPGHLNQLGYILPWAQATFKPPVWMKDYIIVKSMLGLKQMAKQA